MSAKSRGLLILTYHRVLEAEDPLRRGEITQHAFAKHLRVLRRWFNVLQLSKAWRRTRDRTLPARAVAITFDDGYADNAELALPILRHEGLPATFFVATGFLDGGRMWNDTIIESLRVAVPGTLTSAFLALKLFAPKVATHVVAFDKILDEVKEGRADVGLIIHEGQLTYGGHALKKVLDLGVWWKERTGGLPLPLGGNAVRRDLGADTMRALTRMYRDSIAFALAHRDEALSYAKDFGRGLDDTTNDRFVGMYVNDLTLDYGERGRTAIARFLGESADAGLVPRVEIAWVP